MRPGAVPPPSAAGRRHVVPPPSPLGLYLYDPEPSVPPLASICAPGATQKGTTAALVSTRSCRRATPAAFRTTTSNVCSEVQVAGKQCATAKVWIAARKLCEKAGGRLCTSAEVRAGALAQSSCDVGQARRVDVDALRRAGSYLIELGSGRAGARVANTSKPERRRDTQLRGDGPPAAGGVLRRRAPRQPGGWSKW